MTWFWISKGKLNHCQSKVCVSCWFFSRWLFHLKFLEEEANNWIEEPVYRLDMWEAERGNTVLYTIHIRVRNNGVQAWHRRNRGYMNRYRIKVDIAVIEEESCCTSRNDRPWEKASTWKCRNECCYDCVMNHDSWGARMFNVPLFDPGELEQDDTAVTATRH